jgi:hypothetical protein
LQDSENQRFLKDLILFNDSSFFHSWISLCCSAVCSLSLSLQAKLCTNPSTAGSRSNLNENPSSLVAAGFYSNSNQHSSVNPRSWVVGEQRSVDLGQEEFWV